MFGRKKANQEELQRAKDQLEQLVREVAGKNIVYEANISDIDNSRRQLLENMRQVDENKESTEALAEQNIEQESKLEEAVKGLSEQMEYSEKDYEEIVQQIHAQTRECMELVEANKHFTTPAKCINETPVELQGINKSLLELVERMSEASKQISVIALNAAIEAGRMGDGGKQFVSAAESVRSFAGDFGELISEMRGLIDKSEGSLSEFGEQSHRLVGLLKDNNVATGKLYKRHQATEERIERSSIRPYSGEVLEWKEQLIGIRNTEEEILKLQKRSRIQMDDIQSEVDVQEKALQELSDELRPTLRNAKDYIDGVPL